MTMTRKPFVDKEKCSGCGTCLAVCPAKPIIFELREGKSTVAYPWGCIECGWCVRDCPTKAITLTNK